MPQSLDEYLDGLRARFDTARVGFTQQYMKNTFKSIDRDGSGSIDYDEFRSLCAKLGKGLLSRFCVNY
eukprot:SAG31_NODE_17072_length_684_cov_1.389744_1_plen_68_part_00